MKKQKKQPQLESQNLILYPLLPEQMNLLRDDPNELCRSLSLVPDDYAKYGEWVMLAEEQYRKMMADQEYMSFLRCGSSPRKRTSTWWDICTFWDAPAIPKRWS